MTRREKKKSKKSGTIVFDGSANLGFLDDYSRTLLSETPELERTRSETRREREVREVDEKKKRK